MLFACPKVKNPTEKLDSEHLRIGLCLNCQHARRIESARGSEFYFCALSASDPRFPKYPRLPVLHCAGYAPQV
jgi:hypothetical protein